MRTTVIAWARSGTGDDGKPIGDSGTFTITPDAPLGAAASAGRAVLKMLSEQAGIPVEQFLDVVQSET